MSVILAAPLALLVLLQSGKVHQQCLAAGAAASAAFLAAGAAVSAVLVDPLCMLQQGLLMRSVDWVIAIKLQHNCNRSVSAAASAAHFDPLGNFFLACWWS